MTYASINFRTKKAFREAVESGQEVRPWYPEPHKWYAQVEVAEGRVTKVR